MSRISRSLLRTSLNLRRSDVAGALTTILDNAPYGPHVDQAKVRGVYVGSAAA